MNSNCVVLACSVHSLPIVVIPLSCACQRSFFSDRGKITIILLSNPSQQSVAQPSAGKLNSTPQSTSMSTDILPCRNKQYPYLMPPLSGRKLYGVSKVEKAGPPDEDMTYELKYVHLMAFGSRTFLERRP